MKAAVCRRFREPLTIEEVDVASPGPGEVLVDLAACAICHSDIMYIDGDWGGDLPAVFGHEAAGVVTAKGGGVETVNEGDHVVVTLVRSCGECHFCAHEAPVACETIFPLDRQTPLHARDGEPLRHGLRTGAFAEAVLVHHSQVVAIDKNVPLESASLLACGVITGFGAVTNTADVKPGSSVVVVGTGGVGLNALQGARYAGAEKIIAIDISSAKLASAREFGATHGIDADTADIAAQVRDLTGGRGADYVFVTVGAKAAIDGAYDLACKTGAVVLVGMPATGVTSEIDPGTLANNNQRILGSKMGSSRIAVDIPQLVSLYQNGQLKLDPLISGRYPLAEVNEAIASARSAETLRNVIVF